MTNNSASSEPTYDPCRAPVDDAAAAVTNAIPPLKLILEAALLAAGDSVSVARLQALFDDPVPEPQTIRTALDELAQDYRGRGVELVEVSGGFRIQTRPVMATWVARLWEERPGRYSRALLETLALIAYRQPITRGEISDVRGVSVSTTIVKTLQERGWIKIVGHREVPGRPALYGTTREFLDYFNLSSLGQLPALAAPRALADINADINPGADINIDADQDNSNKSGANPASGGPFDLPQSSPDP